MSKKMHVRINLNICLLAKLCRTCAGHCGTLQPNCSHKVKSLSQLPFHSGIINKYLTVGFLLPFL
jgi:hypothetical protein